MKPLYLALPILLLSGCSMMGSLAKESALTLTERFGREHFTFAGDLPDNFGIEVSTTYYPLSPEHCQVYNYGLERYVAREGYKQYTAEINPRPSHFSFDIPMTYHIGLCDMKLGRITYLMEGRYGDRSWDRDGDHGVIAIADTRPEWALEFDAEGQQRMRGYCTWLFQISKLRLEMEKMLNCSRTDETWVLEADPYKRRSIGLTVVRDELPGKTVLLDMRVNPEEEPSVDRRWIQTEAGWKPCQGSETSDRCQSPPVFKSFKMGERECTVYPNCKE